MKRVLIVDDEPHVTLVVRRALEAVGYEVRCAWNGQAGLEEVRRWTPDLMLTDMHMPLMNGRELCQTLRRELPELDFPILVMSTIAAAEQRQWVADLPNIEFFEKPLSMRRLVTHLAGLLGSGPADTAPDPAGGASHG